MEERKNCAGKEKRIGWLTSLFLRIFGGPQIPLFGVEMQHERVEKTGEDRIIYLSKDWFEYRMPLFWDFYRLTFGMALSKFVRWRTIRMIKPLLTTEEKIRWKCKAEREKILSEFRQNFGNQRCPKIFEIKTPFLNHNSPLVQHFHENVANAPALDDIYNGTGGFTVCCNEIWPTSAECDAISVFHMSNPQGQAIRNRYRFISRFCYRGKANKVLSIACGSAQPLLHALAELKKNGVEAQVLLTDVSEKPLEFAKKMAISLGLGESVATEVSAFRHVFHRHKGEKFDLIEICGLSDYLPDSMTQSLIRQAKNHLAHGGVLLLSNMCDTEQSYILGDMCNWHVIFRSPKELYYLAKGSGCKNVNVYVEPWKVHAVAVITN